MKKLKFNTIFWLNIISFLVFGAFIHLAMSTIPGTNQQKFVHPDGRVEIAKTYSKGNKEIITGRPDGYENWQGPTTIEYLDEDGNRTAFEEVNMVDGLRHGRSIITNAKGSWLRCYEMGERVECEKSAVAGFNSSYEILSYKYPWFTLKLNVLGFNDEYIEAFMDTFQIVMKTLEAQYDDFEDLYEETGDILDDTHYTQFIDFNSELTLYYGIELSKNSEFRRAVLDQQRSKENSLHTVLKNSYPNYLKMLNEYEVSDADFMAFGHVFDSLMNSYGPLDVNDPYFIDSVDTRMYEAITWIYDSGSEDLVAEDRLKSLELININKALQRLYEKSGHVLAMDRNDLPPDQVSVIVLSLLFLKFTEADMVRNSVYEWYAMEKGVVLLPTAITTFVSRHSVSSVSVSGSITADGGGEISSRGIVWGMGFNPELTDNVINLGTGPGEFETQITGLSETETYYARSFATNSAGTAYGNCLKFTTNLTTGIESSESVSEELKLYPNPASDMVTVSFECKDVNAEISIINSIGQVVKQEFMDKLMVGQNQFSIDISELGNGLYHVQVKNGSIESSQKLLIAR